MLRRVILNINRKAIVILLYLLALYVYWFRYNKNSRQKINIKFHDSNLQPFVLHAEQLLKSEMARHNLTFVFKRHIIYSYIYLILSRNIPRRRIVILASWRTGSKFLGEILKCFPGTFYTYEPLGTI